METPIYRAAYRWTSEELATAMRRHRNLQLRPSIVRLVGVFMSLLSALALWMLFDSLSGPPTRHVFPWPALMFPAFAVYWIFFRDKALAWQTRRGFKKQPNADHLIEWELSPEELKVYRRGAVYSAVAWSQFVKVLEVEDGFLLYMHPRIFQWLPFRAFESSEAPAQVREFIQASGVTYKKIAS